MWRFLGGFCWSEKSTIHVWGRSGRGHSRKFSANSARFPRTFRNLSWRKKTVLKRMVLLISANFPQNFRKRPFANDPISELLTKKERATKHLNKIFTGLSRDFRGFCFVFSPPRPTIICHPPSPGQPPKFVYIYVGFASSETSISLEDWI